MTRILEIHAIQQFAPSNLNRDDTGAPKDAIFGGVRRARVSSQCFKRAIRKYFQSARLLSDADLADRTKRVVGRLQELLKGRVEDERKVATELINQVGLEVKLVKDVPLTEYLLFLGHRDVEALADIAVQHGGKVNAPNANRQISDLMRRNRAVDVALFGRMLADRKDFNVDAAVQVAHAISTHRVEREFDFFTAVDDLATGNDAVSAMLATVDFNSACYYRYAVINLDLLARNLGNDADLALKAVDAFLEAFTRAVPSGKQNSFAAHNPPELLAVRLREEAPINLAGAFESPVQPKDGYVSGSVKALQAQWKRFDEAYGGAGTSWVLDLSGVWEGASIGSLTALRDGVRAALS